MIYHPSLCHLFIRTSVPWVGKKFNYRFKTYPNDSNCYINIIQNGIPTYCQKSERKGWKLKEMSSSSYATMRTTGDRWWWRRQWEYVIGWELWWAAVMAVTCCMMTDLWWAAAMAMMGTLEHSHDQTQAQSGEIARQWGEILLSST